MSDLPDDYRTMHAPLLMQLAAHKTQMGRIAPMDLPAIVAGIQRYARSTITAPITPMTTIWQNGPVRLLYLAGQNTTHTPVFIIPSIINSARIFDLMPARSFIRWVHAQTGRPVYILDWGDLTTGKEQPASMDDLIHAYIMPAIAHMQQPPHLLGYCLGGTFALQAALRQQNAASLTLLATPYDTYQAGDDIAPHIRGWATLLDTLLFTNPEIPAGWMYSFFAALPQANTPEKFAAIATLADDDDALHHFLAVEDWTQYAPPVPGQLLRDCLQQIYQNNALTNIQWQGGDLPVHIVAPTRDRIVPAVSTIGLQTIIPHSTLLQPDCGHVGAMAGRAGPEKVWPAMAAWWNSCGAA